MSGSSLPIFLNLHQRACLLVGSAGEAERKGMALIQAGARLTIVASVLDGALLQAVKEGNAIWLADSFCPSHLDGMWLAVSALSDLQLNGEIQVAANARGVWLNVVDQPRFCSFVWPALVVRPPVMVAISTGGCSPALAGYLRRLIERLLPEQIGALAEQLAVWRQQVAGGLARRGRFWRLLFDQGLADRFLSGDQNGATEMVVAALKKNNLETQARDDDML